MRAKLGHHVLALPDDHVPRDRHRHVVDGRPPRVQRRLGKRLAALLTTLLTTTLFALALKARALTQTRVAHALEEAEVARLPLSGARVVRNHVVGEHVLPVEGKRPEVRGSDGKPEVRAGSDVRLDFKVLSKRKQKTKEVFARELRTRVAREGRVVGKTERERRV